MSSFNIDLTDVEGSVGNTSARPSIGLSALAGVADTIGGLATEARRGKELATFESGVEQAAQDYLATEDEADNALTDKDYQDVQGFQKMVGRLSQKASTTGDYDRLRVQASMMLKRAKNRNPGLSKYYESIASDVLGDDSITYKRDQALLQQKQAEAQLQAMDRDAQSYGMFPGEVRTQEGAQRYYNKVKTREAADAAKAASEAGTNSLFNNIRVVSNDVGNQVQAVLNNTLAKSGLSFDDISASNSDFHTAVDNDTINALRSDLTTLRSQLEQEIASQYNNFSNNTAFETYKTQVLSSVDSAIALTNKEKAVSEIKNSLEFNSLQQRQDLYSNPVWQAYETMSDINPGAVPPSLSANAQKILLTEIGKVVEGRADESTPPTKEGTQVSMQWMVDNLKKAAELNDANLSDASLNGMVNIAYSLEHSRTAEAGREFVNMLGSKSTAQLIKSTVESNPDMALELGDALAVHGQKLVNTATSAINSLQTATTRRTNRGRGQESGVIASQITPTIKDGVLSIDTGDLDLVKRVGRQRSAATTSTGRQVSKVRGVIRDLNAAIGASVVSGLFGSREEAAATMLAGTPWESLVLGETELTSAQGSVSSAQSVAGELESFEGRDGGDTITNTPTERLGVTQAARDAVGADSSDSSEQVAEEYLDLLESRWKDKDGYEGAPSVVQQALLDASYNIGEEVLNYPGVGKALSDGDYTGVATNLLDTANVDDQSVRGLAIRRAKQYNKIVTDNPIASVEQTEDGTIRYLGEEGDVIFEYRAKNGRNSKSAVGELEVK